MRVLGLMLVIAGVCVLVNEGFTYTKTTKVIDAGPLQASVQHDKHVYLEPLMGVGVVAVGTALLLLGGKPKEAA